MKAGNVSGDRLRFRDRPDQDRPLAEFKIDAHAEIQELARRIAEAQNDLRRVRDARHQLLSQTLSDPNYDARANVREKLTVIRQLLRPNAPDVPLEAVTKYLTRVPEGPQKFALILAQELQQLLAWHALEMRREE